MLNVPSGGAAAQVTSASRPPAVITPTSPPVRPLSATAPASTATIRSALPAPTGDARCVSYTGGPWLHSAGMGSGVRASGVAPVRATVARRDECSLLVDRVRRAPSCLAHGLAGAYLLPLWRGPARGVCGHHVQTREDHRSVSRITPSSGLSSGCARSITGFSLQRANVGGCTSQWANG